MDNAAPNDATRGGNTTNSSDRAFVLRWTAYIGPVIGLLSFGAVSGLVTSLYWPAGSFMLLCVGLVFVYRVLMIRSTKLYTDRDGAWVYSGVFPWNRGVYGVRWPNVQEATFNQTFMGWLLKAYTVTVTNRYQGHDEIMLRHVKHGEQAAMHINELLHKNPSNEYIRPH